MRAVLEQGGHFSGVNRKCQVNTTRRHRWRSPPHALLLVHPSLRPLFANVPDFSASQIKPISWYDGPPGSEKSEKGDNDKDREKEKELRRCREALLIVKHGGVLTHAGRVQSEKLGQNYRMTMYPRYGPSGGGLLRLHSTYRHDLKIYSSGACSPLSSLLSLYSSTSPCTAATSPRLPLALSSRLGHGRTCMLSLLSSPQFACRLHPFAADEGRVQSSAAAFTKGLLDLEGASLTPILVSLVKKDARMLDVFEVSTPDVDCEDIFQHALRRVDQRPAAGPFSTGTEWTYYALTVSFVTS